MNFKYIFVVFDFKQFDNSFYKNTGTRKFIPNTS